MLAEARANLAANWHGTPRRWNYHRILFPHVASWITDDDVRTQLCFDFEQECQKIQLLLAA